MQIERKNHFASAMLTGVAVMALSVGAIAAAPEKDPGQQQATQATDRAAAADTATTSSATPATGSSPTEMSSNDSLAAQTKFDSIDSNHDGSIDKQEAAASKQLNAQFAKLDKNKDEKRR